MHTLTEKDGSESKGSKCRQGRAVRETDSPIPFELYWNRTGNGPTPAGGRDLHANSGTRRDSRVSAPLTGHGPNPVTTSVFPRTGWVPHPPWLETTVPPSLPGGVVSKHLSSPRLDSSLRPRQTPPVSRLPVQETVGRNVHGLWGPFPGCVSETSRTTPTCLDSTSRTRSTALPRYLCTPAPAACPIGPEQWTT